MVMYLKLKHYKQHEYNFHIIEIEEDLAMETISTPLSIATPISSLSLSLSLSYFDSSNSFTTHQLHQEAKTGVPIRWREDQCEINGYGVDPEDGIDTHHIEMDNNIFNLAGLERIRSYSICSRDDNHDINILNSGKNDNYDDDEENEIIELNYDI